MKKIYSYIGAAALAILAVSCEDQPDAFKLADRKSVV